MNLYNSTFKIKKISFMKRSPFKQGYSRNTKGLAQRISESLGKNIEHKKKKSSLLRSEQHRRHVAELGCLITGKPAQACHINFGKAMGRKVCDSLTFPLCPDLHREHDQGGMPRAERWKREWEYVDATRAALIANGKWTREIEAHYQIAIQPLIRMVK